LSLIRKHKERVLAAAAATAAVDPRVANLIAGRGSSLSDKLAEHLAATGQASPKALALGKILLQLQEDRSRLKGLQSVERKVELKRELLPAYDDWIAGIMEAGATTGKGVQDEVLATALVWRIDVGDYAAALPLAQYVIDHNLVLPERFERGPAVLVAEEVAEAAIRDLAAGLAFSASILDQVQALTEDCDMPDQVRAKLFKARGLELASRVEALGENGIAGAKLHAAAEALRLLRIALRLNPKVGVKKEIERLEREHNKLAATAPDNAAGTPAA